MSAVVHATSHGQAVLSVAGLYVLAALVIVLTVVLVFVLALLDHRTDPASEAADTGLALLDAA